MTVLVGKGIWPEFAINSVAQIYARAVTVVTQLLVVPLLLMAWGPLVYGGWVAIDGLRMVLSLSNFGFAQVAANKMTGLSAAGRRADLVAVNATLWGLLGGVSIAMLGVAAILSQLPLAWWFGLTSQANVALTFFLLTLCAVGNVLFGATGAGLRAVGLYWVMVATSASFDLTAAIALASWAVAGEGYLPVAVTMLAVQMGLFGMVTLVLWWRHPWIVPRWRLASWSLAQQMLRPGLCHMSYTFANLTTIQGLNVVTAVVLGPDKVAVLSAVRTLTRVGRMIVASFVFALEPIFARLSGAGALADSRRLSRLLLKTGAFGALVYWVAMMYWGAAVFAHWTQEHLLIPPLFFGAMTTATAIEILWFVAQAPYVSVNRHGLFTAWVTISALCALLLAACGMYLGVGIVSIGFAIVGMHIAILFRTGWVMRQTPATG